MLETDRQAAERGPALASGLDASYEMFSSARESAQWGSTR